MAGILAIDQATVTGFAFAEPGCEPMWGTRRMGAPRAWEGEVYFAFREFLLERIAALSPGAIVFEAPFVPRTDRGGKAAALNPDVLRRGYGLIGQITEIAERCNLGCYEDQSTEVTKFCTGNGRFPGDTREERRAAKKAAVVAACAARGWRVTHNEADAIALLMFREHKLYPEASRQ